MQEKLKNFWEFVRSMYPDKNDDERLETVVGFVIDDVNRHNIEKSIYESGDYRDELLKNIKKDRIDEDYKFPAHVFFCDDLLSKTAELTEKSIKGMYDALELAATPTFKPGDRCRVRENLAELIEKEGWTERMYDFIGKIVTLESFGTFSASGLQGWDTEEDEYLTFPEECLEPLISVNIRSITYI